MNIFRIYSELCTTRSEIEKGYISPTMLKNWKAATGLDARQAAYRASNELQFRVWVTGVLLFFTALALLVWFLLLAAPQSPYTRYTGDLFVGILALVGWSYASWWQAGHFIAREVQPLLLLQHSFRILCTCIGGMKIPLFQLNERELHYVGGLLLGREFSENSEQIEGKMLSDVVCKKRLAIALGLQVDQDKYSSAELLDMMALIHLTAVGLCGINTEHLGSSIPLRGLDRPQTETQEPAPVS